MKSKIKKRVKSSSLSTKAQKALKEAVRKEIEDHKRTGHPIYIWRNGRVVRIPADKL